MSLHVVPFARLCSGVLPVRLLPVFDSLAMLRSRLMLRVLIFELLRIVLPPELLQHALPGYQVIRREVAQTSHLIDNNSLGPRLYAEYTQDHAGGRGAGQQKRGRTAGAVGRPARGGDEAAGQTQGISPKN